MIIQTLAILFIGYSILSSMVLAIGNLLSNKAISSVASILAGFVLLSCLAIMQWYHLGLIQKTSALVYSEVYIALLYCIAPAFYFYSRQILIVDCAYKLTDLLHIIPLIAGLLLPYAWAFPLAFLIGSFYLLWLSRIVYSLRKQRRRFRLELAALAIFFVIAVTVLILAFSKPLINTTTFFSSYAILIGSAFFAATLTLLRFPSITDQVAEAVQANYVQSTLNNIDRPAVIEQLKMLMLKDKLYIQEGLNLSTLAEQLDINSHQLSELINSEFGKGFSLYVREYRINEAKRLLKEEPKSSVLSIGLSIGFSSQSNFYAAFREQVGMAPGEFRKKKDL